MATISRRLLNKSSKNKQSLVFIIRNGINWRLDYFSGIRLNSGFWTERYTIKNVLPDSDDLNKTIDLIESNILAFINVQLLAHSSLTPSEAKLKLYSHLNRNKTGKKEEPAKSIDFYSFFEQFIRESGTTKTPGTIKTYTRTLGALRNFQSKLSFEDIDMKFYYAFTDYMQKEYKMRDNTIGMHIKNIKSLLNEASQRGINTNMEYKNPRFRSNFYEADNIYLRIDELEHLRNIDLADKPGMSSVRDLFMVGCFTGLRFSDFSQIKKANIVSLGENRFLSLRTIKTNTRVVIPLHKLVLEILDRHKGSIPNPYTNQGMNRVLKRLGKMAGIDEPVIIRERKNGLCYKRTLPKYELISSHTARRSFATNAYLSGIPSISIMRITGHSTERAFLQYIKVSQEENAINLANHSFFK